MRPNFDTQPVAANIYVLGALFGQPSVSKLIDARAMEEILGDRWPKVAEKNLVAFRAGLDSARATLLGGSPCTELLNEDEDDLG